MPKFNDLTNKKFGKLTVIKRLPSIGRATMWECDCECGRSVSVRATHLMSAGSKSCGCTRQAGSGNAQWTGIGEISGAFWNKHIVNRIKQRSGEVLPNDISKEFIWSLYLKQNKSCALTGLPLSLPKTGRDLTYTASIDRIDSTKGYTRDNLQWVHKDINMMKRSYSQEYFVVMCKAVANFSG